MDNTVINNSQKTRIPSATVILLVILLLAILATWIIPGGEYSTYVDPETGATMLSEEGFSYVEHKAFKIQELPMAIIKAVSSSLSIILVCAMGNALVVMANSDGMFYSLIASLCKKYKGRESKLIVIFTVFFALLGFVVPPQCFIGFTGTLVILFISIGYDSVMGLAIVMLSVACSAMSGPVNTITAIAQAVVGLPIFSGIVVRFIAFAIFLVVTILYFLSYGKKIKADPTKSYMYGLEDASRMSSNIDDVREIKTKDYFIMGLVVLTFAVIAVGSMKWNWSTDNVSAAMMVGTVVIGIVMGHHVDKIFKLFVKAVGELTSMYLVIILANTIANVMKGGKIMDTIIHFSAEQIQKMPGFLVPIGVMIFICIMNVILPSGAGKAVMMMPIIAPIGQFVGMTAQASVLAYTFGDGFSNYIIPHDPSVISYLNAANVPYTVWLKFMSKLFWIWVGVGAVIMTTLYYTGYGPF